MKSDPIFDAVLDVMGGENRKPYAPNIVPFPQQEPKFNHEDDALMHDILGSDLAEPVQSLLATLRLYELTKDSFGADERKVIEALIPKLQALRAACIVRFNAL